QDLVFWKFDLRICRIEEDIIHECTEPGFNGQSCLPKILIQDRDWFYDIADGLAVDPGTTQECTYLTSVPASTKFIYIYSKFKFGRSRKFQTSPRAFSVDA